MTLLALCSFAFFRFSRNYTLVVKIGTEISWRRRLRYLTAVRRQDARMGLIHSAPDFLHRLQAALETKCFFKANLLDISSDIFNPYLVLTPGCVESEAIPHEPLVSVAMLEE